MWITRALNPALTCKLAKVLNRFGGPLPTPGSCSLFASRSASSFQHACTHDPESNRSDEDNADINWDDLGFGLVPTDYMYVMKCSQDDTFSYGEVNRYGNLELSPSSGVLNYGQGLFEGLKAYRKGDGCGFLLFRPEENARRMQMGAKRMCMPSPSVDQFVNAVKQTVLANKRWVPPQGKGSLYLRPLLMGSGPVLGLAPAPEYMFLVYASPVGTYFKEGLAPINLIIDDEIHRATPGGTGGVKTITNYGPVLKAQVRAKSNGFTDVLFLDSTEKRYLEEASSCNLFIVKDNVISTPITRGTILAGITRKSIMEIAGDYGYKVEERLVSVEDLTAADEVFCTGTAVVVAPVGSITYQGQRYAYKTGIETVSQQLYSALTAIQMGLVKDKKSWTVEIEHQPI
ncbi:branched-chain-amino-acid aminotransferase 2, chloroplastic-like isoform X1 [Phoenix dactylifera]|uniref:Branched-chain-amino-acid aminotransferase n=1 Tax=Phoenix dactylifera TaxID=42345 RepID=A0A8B7BUL4_PHODC|nr:branched-chain-amino-acid aminotransferase 2, chloroplastic-like isoform X1 [Phoenix dactylifera]